MKIAIGKPDQVGEGWEPFPTDAFLHPHEIRQGILDRSAREETTLPVESRLVTMNRTVLDMVRREGDGGPFVHDDVSVWLEGQLVPLVSLHDADWLACFSLGDLFDHGELDTAPTPSIPETPKS